MPRVVASCSNRSGLGTWNSCGIRARADDVAVGVGGDRLHRRRADVDPDGDLSLHGRATLLAAASAVEHVVVQDGRWCTRSCRRRRRRGRRSCSSVRRPLRRSGRARRRPTATRSDRSRCRTRLRRRACAARSHRGRACASSAATARASDCPMRLPSKPDPMSNANEICASSSAATDDTRIGVAVAERTHARGRPPPRLPSAGADTTPTHERRPRARGR